MNKRESMGITTEFNVGWVERMVRFLIGLPIAVAYFYVRHFSVGGSYGLMIIGIAVMSTGLLGHDPKAHGLQFPTIDLAHLFGHETKWGHTS